MARLREVRGRGLMIGIEIDGSGAELRRRLLFDRHIFTGGAGASTVRLLPALCLPRDLADLVNGSDEDALKTSVERLAALRGPGAAQDRRPDPAQAASVETDPRAALAEQIFGS